MTDSDPITRLNAALEGRYRIERDPAEGGVSRAGQETARRSRYSTTNGSRIATIEIPP